jgi:hypothetical protein
MRKPILVVLLILASCDDTPPTPPSTWPADPAFRVGFGKSKITTIGFERYVDRNNDGHRQPSTEPFIDSGRDGKLDFEESGALGPDGKPGKAGVDDDNDGCIDDTLGCSPADDPADPCSAACEYLAAGSDDLPDPAHDNYDAAANPTGTEKDGKWQGAIIAGYGGALTDDDLRPAQGIHDDLWARAVVFSKDDQVFALVATDFAGFLHIYGNPVKRMISERTKIPYDHIVYMANHDHDAPDVVGIWSGPADLDYEYLSFVQDGMVQAVVDAVDALRPATLTSATAEMDGCYDTATLELKPGSQCHFPPGLDELRSHQAAYDTPINQIDLRDPIVNNYKVTALIAKDIATGATLGTVTSFNDHPEVLGSDNDMISSDFPSYARQRMEERYGGIAVYISGTTGAQIGTLRGTNVPLRDEAGNPVMDPTKTTASGKPFPAFAPNDGTGPLAPPYDKIRSQGFILADTAIAALDAAAPSADPMVSLQASDVNIPLSNLRLGLGLTLLLGEAAKHGYPKDPADDIQRDPGCPTEVGGDPFCFHASIVVATVGDVTFLTSPGEPSPEYLYGRPDSTVDYGAPWGPYHFPAMPSLRQYIPTRDVMMIDIANGYFGYLIPESDYLTDDSHPNFYEELPSAGNRFGDTVGNKWLRMLGAPDEVTFNSNAVLIPVR